MNRQQRRAATARNRKRLPYAQLTGGTKKVFDAMVNIYASALISDDSFRQSFNIASLPNSNDEVRKTLTELIEWGYLKFVLLGENHWALSMSDPQTGELVGNPISIPKAYAESLDRPN